MEFTQYPKNWQKEIQLTNDLNKKIKSFQCYNLKEEKKKRLKDFHHKNKLKKTYNFKHLRKIPQCYNSNDAADDIKEQLINEKTSDTINTFIEYNKPILNDLEEKKLFYIKRKKNRIIEDDEKPLINEKRELQLDRRAQSLIDNFQKYIDQGSEENLFNCNLLNDFHDSLGPDWYQELSDRQMTLANCLYHDLLNDLKQNTTFRCSRFLQQIGLTQIPNHNLIKRILELSRGNDLAFLWYTYDIFYHRHKNTINHKDEQEYSFNERLILSTICHLDMITTLRELDRILPKAIMERKQCCSNATIEKKRQQCYCTYFSPYLEPLTRPKIPQPKCIQSPIIPNPKFTPYEIYKDSNYIVLNESNRWYARKISSINKINSTPITATINDRNNNINEPNDKEPTDNSLIESTIINNTNRKQEIGLFNRFKENFCCIPPCSNDDDEDEDLDLEPNENFIDNIIKTVPSEITEMEKNERIKIIKSICKELLFNNKKRTYGKLLKNLLILLRDNTRCYDCDEFINQNDDYDDDIQSTRANKNKFIHLIELTNSENIEEFKNLAKKYIIQIILKYTIRELVKNSSTIKNIHICKSCTDCYEEYKFYKEILSVDDHPKTETYEYIIYNEIIRNDCNLAMDLDKKLKQQLNQSKIECCPLIKSENDDDNNVDDDGDDGDDNNDNNELTINVCMKNIWQLETNLWTNKMKPLLNKKPSSNRLNRLKNHQLDLTPLLIKAINLMRKNPKFVLCSLPDIHKLPLLCEWIKLRYNFKYTTIERHRSILKTKKLWTLKMDNSMLNINDKRLKIPKAKDCCQEQSILNYDYKECLMNQINEIYGKYEENLKLKLIEENRLFWPTMKPYLCTMGPPRNTFYAYLPAKQNEICIFRPWQRHEHKIRAFKRK